MLTEKLTSAIRPRSGIRRGMCICAAATLLVLPVLSLHAASSSGADDALRAVLLLEQAVSDRKKIGQAYQQLVREHPEHPAVRVAYGNHLLAGGDAPAAEKQWMRALALDPSHGEANNRLAGYLLQHKGAVKQAAALFTSAVESVPDNARYQADLATVLVLFRHELHGKHGADSEAVLRTGLEHYRRSTELDPFNKDAARAYAETFYILEEPDWTAAMKAWEHATNLMPVKDFGYIHLARVSLKLRDKTRALHYLDSIQNESFSGVRTKLRAQAEGL